MGSDTAAFAILGGVTGVLVLGVLGRMYFDNTPASTRYVPIQGQIAGRQSRRHKHRRGNKTRKH